MEKQRWEESGSRSQEVRRSEKRKSGKQEDAGARKGIGKSTIHCVFPMMWAPEGRKVTSLKRRVRSQLARWEMKNCTPLWREAHLQAKMHKTHHSQTTFGSCDVEKVHAVVARSTFVSKKVKTRRLWREAHFQKPTVSDHFWKLRCRKSARRCGAKHISKSKV